MKDIVQYIGISDTRIVSTVVRLAEQHGGQILVITPGERRAKRLVNDLSFFVHMPVLLWPEAESGTLRYEAKSPEERALRLRVLEMLASEEPCIVVSPAIGLGKKLPPASVYESESVSIDEHTRVERDTLIRHLARLGYERMPIVESPGQFAVRGDIVDAFPPGKEAPYRIELFDDEVDSLRLYDPATQRSTARIEQVTLFPAQLLLRQEEVFEQAGKRLRTAYQDALAKLASEEAVERLREQRDELIARIEEGRHIAYLEHYISYFYPEASYVWDHFRHPGLIVVDDPLRVGEMWDVFERESAVMQQTMLARGEGVPQDFSSLPSRASYDMLPDLRSRFSLHYCTPFAQSIPGIEPDHVCERMVRQAPSYEGRMERLREELGRFSDLGYRIHIVCSTQERMTNVQEFLSRERWARDVIFSIGNLSAGFEDVDNKYLVLSESDVFPYRKQRRAKRKDKGREIRAFTDIKVGDFVVHDIHGIGRFSGVEKLQVQGSVRDYLKISYAGEDVLYIPADQMHAIQKYVGSEGAAPRVHRLSGGEWQRVKERARDAIRDMAEEFLQLAARREQATGFAFGEDSAWQKEFEEAFEFEETEDQIRAAEEIKRDMQRPKPMDRLLLGDVGYGKTEVAARALFKCLEQGKQAVVLAPTTLLASQHYHTLSERFASYPFYVEMLSRFRTPAEQAEIIRRVESGEVDLLIGTHRILSGDVVFKNLGLLIIDEEQRFGVQHKDRIKNLKEHIDVLALSATPIPRTLHLSLIGVRDMSVIEEPPEDRYPVQTYVVEFDERLIRDVIRRELERGGQVFVVYNRVRGIQRVASQIAEWVPEARIAVGHGQMGERELEDVMQGFIETSYDVLVSTTIIESGLDIPNANTIIMLDADRFGMSQLYQLRGRVGRSNRIAYAYLVYRKDKVLSEIAEKRLRAIREFTEFGAGFHIAMRDLELRGAGNILGTEQSGHMMSVGYEMYCRLVEEVVGELRGEEVRPVQQEETVVELSVAAYLPETYIADEMTRLSIYKRAAAMRSREDVSDLLDELVDRFGDPPVEAEQLLSVAFIHSLASSFGIARVVLQNQRLVFQFREDGALTPERIAVLLDAFGTDLTIYGGVEARMAIARNRQPLLEQALGVLERMQLPDPQR